MAFVVGAYFGTGPQYVPKNVVIAFLGTRFRPVVGTAWRAEAPRKRLAKAAEPIYGSGSSARARGGPPSIRRPTGHVYLLDRKRGRSGMPNTDRRPATRSKKMLGPAWTGRGRLPAGYFTKRLAEEWLHDKLDELRFAGGYALNRSPTDGRPGSLSSAPAAQPVRTGATFADAAAEYLWYSEQDHGCKPSTLRNYRNAIKIHLLPVFGEMALEDISMREIDRWRAGLSSARMQRALSNKTKNNLLVLMHAIFRRAVKLYGLPANPVANVDRFRVRSSGDIQVFSPEEIWALVRAATSEADGAIFLTAAFTGLRRGELLALRWRDIDFAGSTIRVRTSYAAGRLSTPKSGKVRAVPMAPDVASALGVRPG